MKKYQVWDKLNADRDDAITIEAFAPSDAAQEYAEQDHDGLCDGIYDRGHPVMVCDGNDVVEFDVSVEMIPSFHATRKGG